ncbi:hypothetical protein ER308_15420 [Egibacter rhizosphaerae]|uniref:SsuA/THI5-like domain-containing protein n=1 Tax=Egibacter rhizosphaerae TaxID=1670831 RepID=A0A411YHV4_9ACTN|nr:ABC transporter substrate-binding protein [Egibacter rhizosphaerae]QBI20820.1 hypothetical protein ER308_15420 [Egibacter rhizosphaerae]
MSRSRKFASRPRKVASILALATVLAVLVAACEDEEEPLDLADDPEEEEPDAEEPADPDDEEDEEPEADDPEDEEDPGEDDAPDGSGELASITVGDIQGIPSTFLQFAVDEGFLEDEGLDVTVEPNPGGAANIPGVESGEFEIAGSNVISVYLARAEGLPMQMVSAGTFATEEPDEDFSHILVPEDSDIEEPTDLEGRSVAVNTLANIAEVTIRAALERNDVEHSDIEFVEMGFPDMVPAALDGEIDAVHVIEPFQSIGWDQGMREIIAPYAETEPGLAIGSYFSSDEYIEENPEVIDSFIAGVSAGGEYVEENPEEFRDALVELADLDPEVADGANLPAWGGPVDTESAELLSEYMVEFDLFDEAPPTDEVIYQP